MKILFFIFIYLKLCTWYDEYGIAISSQYFISDIWKRHPSTRTRKYVGPDICKLFRTHVDQQDGYQSQSQSIIHWHIRRQKWIFKKRCQHGGNLLMWQIRYNNQRIVSLCMLWSYHVKIHVMHFLVHFFFIFQLNELTL